MKKEVFIAKLDYFNLVHGVTLRVISAFGDSEIDFRPLPNIRTVKELVFHIYAQEKVTAEAIQYGRFTAESANASNPESETAAKELVALKRIEDVLTYATGCHEAADGILRGIAEDELNRRVESPFGAFPGWKFFDFIYDEHWHHRGQLYTYLRLLDKEPPMLYAY